MIFAYIDPGMGSLAIQAVIAGIVAIPFFFRSTLSRAIARFRRRADVTVDESPR